MAQDEVIEILKKYCLLLIESGIPVDKAFLFGSYSRGEARKDSDIDIMIVSSIFDNYDIKNKTKAWRLTEQININIEPYTIGLNKFLTDEYSPIIEVVKQEGIEIKI